MKPGFPWCLQPSVLMVSPCSLARGERLHRQALQPALPAQVEQRQELQVPRGGVQHRGAHGGGEVRLSSRLCHEEQHLRKGR